MDLLTDEVYDERTARMVLTMIADPGDHVTGHILRRYGGVETLRLLESGETVPGFARADAMRWREKVTYRITDELMEQLTEAESYGIGTVMPGDAHWPEALDVLGEQAPYLLYTRGATSLLTEPVGDRVTLTGSRAATAYGEKVTTDFASKLAEVEKTIVAGGAYGIEGAAHRAALAAGGHTIAVLANGVDRPYPSGNAEMLARIGDVGLLVSEMPPGTAPTRDRFLSRSRLLAALSSATVVVEAGAFSAVMVTADRAYKLGRGVGAVPGPVTSVASSGPHKLIREHRAGLVVHSDEVQALMQHGAGAKAARPSKSPDFSVQSRPPEQGATRSL